MARVGLFVMFAVACSAGPVAPVTSLAPSMEHVSALGADLRLVWRNPGMHPIGQPVAVADVAVGIVAEDRTTWLVAIEPATGAKRWQRPITPSGQPLWDPIAFRVLPGDRLAYLRPTRPDNLYAYAELVVADARTGRDLMKSPDARFRSAPIACGDAVCALSQDPRDDRNEHVRLDLATGAFTIDNRNIPLRATYLAHDSVELLDLADYPDSTIGLLRDGQLRWHRRVADLFPPGFSVANGGRWHRFAEHGVIVGSTYGGSWRWDEQWGVDLVHETATVGLAEDTGQVLWRVRGTMFGCGPDRHAPTWCRARGAVTGRRDEPARYTDIDVTVEAFDPRTGKPTWSTPVGWVVSLVPGTPAPAIAGADRWALARPDGLGVLDYTTGALAPAAAGATFWCTARARYTHAAVVNVITRSSNAGRPGGRLAYVCDGRDHPATALPDAAATFAVGAAIGDRAVIATRDGFLGFVRVAK